MNKLLIISSVLICISSFSANAGLYRWVDANGKVHYSDKVPQARSQHGHVVLNSNGTKKEEIISAKKRKEINDSKSLLKTQQKEQIEKDKKQALDDLRDTQLLNMFTSTNELKKIYNSKFEMTDESINLLKARHRSQTRKLDKLERQYERSKNALSKEALTKKIDDLLDNLKVYQQAITENYVEKEKLKKEFEENLVRFSELLAMRQVKK